MKKIFLTLIIILTITFTSCELVIPNPNQNTDVSIKISTLNNTYYTSDDIIIDIDINKKELIKDIEIQILNTNIDKNIIKNVVNINTPGIVKIIAKYNDIKSNEITLNIKDTIYNIDPYQNISKEEFYENYQEAINYQDAYYRNLHGYMSGSLETPEERPILSNYQPKEDNLYIRNTNAYYNEEQDIYYITDGYSEIVDVIYKKAGYISLDEVSAHLLAFGTTPGNYISKKSTDPKTSIWNEYLRLNHSSFSGSTTKYPYEPKLPNISGCGGDLYYYEIDFGTKGTTCDPSYDIKIYNDGKEITRGAARLVYTRFDKNKNDIIDINERYVFYTYNHYNDFQEYLNYQNGWGKIFGNITGGGKLSSKTDYNPTPYIESKRKDLSK